MQQDQGPAVPTGSDAELITRVRSGDRAAFGTLYSRHSSAAVTLARQFARSPSEVDDLVSEAFARVLDALLGGRGPDTAFRAYLFTTLRNTAFDRTRKDSRLRFTDDVAAHETPEVADDPVVAQLENTMVATAFAALPERWQAVLWHTQVEGQSPAEVGVLLGMTPNAITSLAFRAREGLREAYLQAHLADTAAERCRATVDRLGGWARGGLATREKAQVDAHLDECDRCRALAAELAEINTGLRGLLAPLLLGGAAAGYLAASSSSGAAVLLTGGAAVGAGAGAAGATAGAGAAGTAGGSTSPGVLSWFARPWSIAAGGAAVAAAVAATLVITLTGGHSAPPLADRPPATSSAAAVTSTTGTSMAVTNSGGGAGPAGPGAPTAGGTTAQPQGPPVVTQPVTTATSPSADPTGTGRNPGGPAPETQPRVAVTEPVIPVGPPPAPAPPASSPATMPPARTTPAPTVPASATATSAAGTPTAGPTATGAPATTGETAAPTTAAPTSATSATSPAPTSPAPPTPAALSDPQFDVTELAATAGAPATVAFTVTNSGDTDSAPQRLQVDAPAGVFVSGATDSTPALGLRRASAALAATAADPAPASGLASGLASGPTADPAAVACTAEGACTYTVPAHRSVTITLTLAVTPDAMPGTLTLTVNGTPVGAALPLRVAPGLIGLHLDPPADWTIGTAAEAHLTGTVADGVTDVGTVSIPLHGADIWFAPIDQAGPDKPQPCSASDAMLTCSNVDIRDGVVDFGPVMVTAVLPGDLTATATLPGAGGTLPVGAPVGSVLSASAPSAAGGPITVTGPFGGALVGASSLQCDTVWVTRGNCQPPYGSAMVPRAHPRRLDMPPGATLVAATLTWAATAPADSDASALDTVTFHACPADAGPTDQRCRSQTIGPAGVKTPVGDTPTEMYVRAADVTDLVGPGDQVWADGIDASAVSAGTTPMAGWSVAIVWSEPGLSNTVDVSNPGTYSLSGDDAVTLAPAGTPISDLTTVIWAADPWATKHIVVGDVETGGTDAEPTPIQGVRTGCDPAIPAAQCATGVDVVSGIAAGSGRPISFTNTPGLASSASNWAQSAGFSNQDGLWLGPTLIVRGSA